MSNVTIHNFDQDRSRAERVERDAKYEALSDFGKFWSHCDRKEGKAKAEPKFNKITGPGGFDTTSLDRDSGHYEPLHLEATAEQLIEGMRAYSAAMQAEKRERQFILQPAQFLNQGRWRDYE